MIFAEMEYRKHYSDFHAELLAFIGKHFSEVQSGLQSRHCRSQADLRSRGGREAHGRPRRFRRAAAEHDQRLCLRRHLVAARPRAQDPRLVVLGMNAAINRAAEFKVHVNGALNNGCTPDEIREVCLNETRARERARRPGAQQGDHPLCARRGGPHAAHHAHREAARCRGSRAQPGEAGECVVRADARRRLR